MAFYQLTDSTAGVGYGIMRGAGQSPTAALITGVSYWVIGLPVCFSLSLSLSLLMLMLNQRNTTAGVYVDVPSAFRGNRRMVCSYFCSTTSFGWVRPFFFFFSSLSLSIDRGWEIRLSIYIVRYLDFEKEADKARERSEATAAAVAAASGTGTGAEEVGEDEART